MSRIELDRDELRVAYRQGVEDARAQVIAALCAESAVGYVETASFARACAVVQELPRPQEDGRWMGADPEDPAPGREQQP